MIFQPFSWGPSYWFEPKPHHFSFHGHKFAFMDTSSLTHDSPTFFVGHTPYRFGSKIPPFLPFMDTSSPSWAQVPPCPIFHPFCRVPPTGLGQNPTIFVLHGHKFAFMGTIAPMHDSSAIFVRSHLLVWAKISPLFLSWAQVRLHGHKFSH